MIIKFRYDTDSEVLVNGNCSAINFLNYIEPYIIGWNKRSILDICDSSGHCKQLSRLGNENAVEVFQERETYVAVTMEKLEHGLDNCPDIYPTLLLPEEDKMHALVTENMQNRRKPQLGQHSSYVRGSLAAMGATRAKQRGGISSLSVKNPSTTKANSPGVRGRR